MDPTALHTCHSSLGVEHPLSKRKVVGSNPACGSHNPFLSQPKFFGEGKTKDVEGGSQKRVHYVVKSSTRCLPNDLVDLTLVFTIECTQCSGGVVGYHVSLTH